MKLRLCLRLLQLPQFFRSFVLLHKWETNIHPVLIVLCKRIAMVFLFLHWNACAWWSVSLYEGIGSSSWTVSPDLVAPGTSLAFQYLNAFHWSVGSVTSLGGVSTTPSTSPEMIYNLVVMFIGAGMMVALIGEVGSLFSNFDVRETEFREKVGLMNAYMRYRNFPPHLREAIRDYYEYVWARQRGLNESEILEELPKHLRKEILLFINLATLEKVPFVAKAMRGEGQSHFMNQLLLALRPHVFSPGSTIVEEGEIGNEMYLIARGEVEVILPNNRGDESPRRTITLSAGSFFGEMALLLPSSRRTATVRALTFCDLFSLERDAFERLLRDFPAFRKSVMEAAEERYKERWGANGIKMLEQWKQQFEHLNTEEGEENEASAFSELKHRVQMLTQQTSAIEAKLDLLVSKLTAAAPSVVSEGEVNGSGISKRKAKQK